MNRYYNLKESYNSEVDLMYDYEKIFKKKGWNVKRKSKNNQLSAMHISISKDVGDEQLCFYIYCDYGTDGYGDYYSCQINDSSDAEYDYGAVEYKGFEVSGRGFLLFERNVDKFCKYLEQTLDELANLKGEIKESVNKLHEDSLDDIIPNAESEYYDILIDLFDECNVNFRESHVVNGGRICYIDDIDSKVIFKHPNTKEYVPLKTIQLDSDGSVYLSEKNYGGGWYMKHVPLDEVWVYDKNKYINYKGKSKKTDYFEK